MKTFGKIVVCIIVILAAVGIGYLAYSGEETSGNSLTSTATNTQNTTNNVEENKTVNEIDENKNYIGEEENKEDLVEDKQPEENSEQKTQSEQEMPELTGKDKAVDVVKNQYALDGQTVKFDHMEGENYVVKINAGTAVTWYLVDGITWEAKEY